MTLISRIASYNKDFENIVYIRKLCGWHHDKVKHWFLLQEKGYRIQWIFELDKNVVGMIALDLEDDDKTVASKKDGIACITSLFILPDYRGKGYAKLFNKYVEKYVKENLNEIKTLTMHTRSDNIISYNMYKELDYIEYKRDNRYPESDVPAVFFRKNIGNY